VHLNYMFINGSSLSSIDNFNGFHPVVCIYRNNIYIYIVLFLYIHTMGWKPLKLCVCDFYRQLA
jgi:hypothetical protein